MSSLEMVVDGLGVPTDNVLLYNSVRSNEEYLVNTTLDRGAEIDLVNTEQPKNVATPLRAACAQAHMKALRLLLARGANIFVNFDVDRWTALHSAAHSGHDNVLRLLLSEVHDLHENTVLDGFHLLHLIAEIANPKLLRDGVDLLLWVVKTMPTVDINARSTRRGYADWTPLHVACARGQTKVAECMLRSGAQLPARTAEFHFRSPLLNTFVTGDGHDGAQVACSEPNIDFAGTEWVDRGLLPIHLAAFGGHLRTLSMLLRFGQSVNATSSRHRWTPLMFSVWSMNAALVREVLRLGGRTVVNFTDQRGDGSAWTPLGLAVVRSKADVVNALISYGANPFMRLSAADFPGKAFISHIAKGMPDAADNKWSGRDAGITLVHLATLRGSVSMLRTVLEAARNGSNFAPTSPSGRPAEGAGVGENKPSCDLVTMCTTEGWSPAVLAVTLHAVDPKKEVRPEVVEAFQDPTVAENTRSDVFLELLSMGHSLQEFEPDAAPPVLPQRFHDVSETLVCRVVDEFVSLCNKGDAAYTAFRILYATLCVACRFNRHKVVKHLLESGLCDPRCHFLHPVGLRPLHVAASCGFGFLAQLILEHKADPLESDENMEMPVFKLARYYSNQVTDLQGRVAELEAEVSILRQCDGRNAASSPSKPASPSFPPSAAVSPTRSIGGNTTPASP